MTMAMIGIPASLNGELNDSVNKFTQVYLMAEDGSDLDNVGESALNLIKTRHGDFDDSVYTLNIMATYIDLLDSVINIFTTFIAAVSAIAIIFYIALSFLITNRKISTVIRRSICFR